MSHEIWKDKFAAVREDAWHRIGTTYDRDVLPSEAFRTLELGYEPKVLPLVAVDEAAGSTVETGLFGVFGPDGDVYGTVTHRWGYVRLEDLVPDLDVIAKTRPLSATGALRKGSEIFFSFGGEQLKIAGEEYRDYVTVLHSYRPGSAWRVLWSPVRVVCANTLMAADESERQIQISHSKNMRPMVDAAMVITNAVEMSKRTKSRLEQLAKVKVSEEIAKDVLEKTYALYVPRRPNLFGAEDGVDAELVARLIAKYEAQRGYAERLAALAWERYDVTAETFLPKLRGTAYALYNAVVEVADHRGGRAESSLEASVGGSRLQEKARAFKELSALAGVN